MIDIIISKSYFYTIQIPVNPFDRINDRLEKLFNDLFV